MTTDNSKAAVLVKSAILGSARGMVSLPFQHPFDALKTNMQAHQLKLKQSYQFILKTKGWRGFYNGFSMNMIRVMIKQGYRWPLTITMQSFFKKILPNTSQFIRQPITGFAISFCELIIICPFQRVKVWLMTTQKQDQSKIKMYYKRPVFNLKDLYTGFISLLIRQGLSWSSYLTSMQVMKNMMKSYKKSETLSTEQLFLVSIPVSIINTLFIMPIDCIKTFYQQYREQYRGQSFVETVKQIKKMYGIKGLYLGWSARMLQYTIQSSFTLIAIEELTKQFEGRKRKA